MRDGLKNLSPLHMGLIGLVVFAIVVAVACGVRAYINSNAPEVDDSVSELTTELVEGVELSELQTALLNTQNELDEQVSELLELNLWTAGSTTARFGQNAVAEVATNGEVKTFPFVVYETQAIAAKDAEGWTGKVYLSDVASEYSLKRVVGAEDAPYILECPDLELSQSYQLGAKSDTFGVYGLEDESLGIFDDKTKAAIEETVEAECSKLYPLATAAVWDGVLSIDYDDNTITLVFDIEGAGSTVTVVCNLGRVVESVEADAR